MRILKIALITLAFTSATSYADTYVNGYYRKNGTYVQPHYRSDSNNTRSDNWSTKGNVNPYTGAYGTKNAYDSNNYYGSGSSYNSDSSDTNSWDD